MAVIADPHKPVMIGERGRRAILLQCVTQSKHDRHSSLDGGALERLHGVLRHPAEPAV